MPVNCLLLVDDDLDFLDLFVKAAKVRGMDKSFRILTADSAEAALKILTQEEVDVVVSDVQMPGPMDGYDLFTAISRRWLNLPVILMTAYGSVEKAVAAVKEGAYHYFEKPLQNQEDRFWDMVSQAVRKKRFEDELLRQNLEPLPEGEIVGRSETIRQVLAGAAQVAATPATVLIQGQTGTGKELVARTIHRLAGETERPFVAVNCAALAPGLLESELFGHERGAFTGAVADRPGVFERAHGGTLFLDEVSELSPQAQAELLRVLDTRRFTRVGGRSERRADFRLICATNLDLNELVERGAFRRDLFFRVNVFPLKLPPLRERKEDIPALVAHFLLRFSQALGRPVKRLNNEAMIFLHQYDWPGNVRELVNLIERGVIAARAEVIGLRDLFPSQQEAEAWQPVTSLKEMERLMIGLALERSGGNKTAAAQHLGIGLKTLYQKMKRYGLT